MYIIIIHQALIAVIKILNLKATKRSFNEKNYNASKFNEISNYFIIIKTNKEDTKNLMKILSKIKF